MALQFKNSKGKAATNKVESFEIKDGENVVRLVGGVLARYVYWLKGSNNKDIPVECLAFNREEERFNNAETDLVPEYHPDMKCSWAYAMNVIDVKNNKVVAFNLKKKLFAQIMDAAESLGDPTDPDTGWDCTFKRVKTGPHAFNVEYTLQTLKCKPRALSQEERAMVAEAKTIDEKFPRPTVEDVRKTLERIKNGGSEEEGTGEASAVPEEARDL